MPKITGKGATITKGGTPIAYVTDYTWSESLGTVYGQSESKLSVNAILDTDFTPERTGGRDTYVLLPASTSSQSITMTNAEIESVSVSVGRESVKQSLTITSKNTATIA